MTLAEQGREIDKKRAELHAIFERSKTDEMDPSTGKNLYNMDTATIQEVNERNRELNELCDRYEQTRLANIAQENLEKRAALNQIDRQFHHAGARKPSADRRDGEKLSDRILESHQYKNRRQQGNRSQFGMEVEDVDLKTLLQTGAGFAPPTVRTGRVVDSAQRRPVVADLIPTDTTTNATIEWMEETTFTNNASTVSEGASKPESALVWTARESTVRKIATYIPVTEEQLNDIGQMRNLLDNRLMLMLQLAEEIQLLKGQGTAPDLQGILTKSGIQTQARGSDTNEDAVYRAFKKIRWTGMAEPSGVVMHPDNWETVRLRKTTTNEYIFGDPSIEVDARLWGKPVIITSAIDTNLGLTGDFVLYSHISRMLGIRIDVGYINDQFIKNTLTVLAEMRENLEIFRAAAFCQITGLN